MMTDIPNAPTTSMERGINACWMVLSMKSKLKDMMALGINGNKLNRLCICAREIDKSLKNLGIPAWVDYWGYDRPHDWPSWLEQVPYFLYHILD